MQRVGTTIRPPAELAATGQPLDLPAAAAATCAADVRALPNDLAAPRERRTRALSSLAILLIHSSGLWCASTRTDGKRRNGTARRPKRLGGRTRVPPCGGSRLRSNDSRRAGLYSSWERSSAVNTG